MEYLVFVRLTSVGCFRIPADTAKEAVKRVQREIREGSGELELEYVEQDDYELTGGVFRVV
jgi:hypothetical protein